MTNLFYRPGFYKALALALFAASVAVFLSACSAVTPAFKADLEDIATDQATAIKAAEEGDTVRAAISGLLALAGSVVYAVGSRRKYDKAPFEGVVGGETVKVTEDELVKAVVLAKKDGQVV